MHDKQVRRAAVIATVVTFMISALGPAAASASTIRFTSRNNYAVGIGSIVFCDSHSRGACFPDATFTVHITLRDTPQRQSSSYAYLSYTDWEGRSHNSKIAHAGNGRTVAKTVSKHGQPSSARITVCTRRGIWICGIPSPR